MLKSVIMSKIQFSWQDFFKLESVNAYPLKLLSYIA